MPGRCPFSRAFSQATYTRPSCVSLMTSLYPSATGVWTKFEKLHDNYLTLAEIMRNQGFVTIMVTQNVNAGPHSGLHQGFSYVFDPSAIGSDASDIYQGHLFQKCIEDHKNRNLFIYLHLIDPHGPYDPPIDKDILTREIAALKNQQPVEKDLQFDPPWLTTPTHQSRVFLYDEEIKHNDLYFADFIATLKNSNIYDETLIAFISDHGEHLGEHGLWGHKPPGYRQVLNVPVILSFPEKIKRRQKHQ
ncbi:MAG: sulfatase-like hydrolase/transferase [Desulfobacterales bacterium]